MPQLISADQLSYLDIVALSLSKIMAPEQRVLFEDVLKTGKKTK